MAGRTLTSSQTVMSGPLWLRTERIFPAYGPRGLKLPVERVSGAARYGVPKGAPEANCGLFGRDQERPVGIDANAAAKAGLRAAGHRAARPRRVSWCSSQTVMSQRFRRRKQRAFPSR